VCHREESARIVHAQKQQMYLFSGSVCLHAYAAREGRGRGLILIISCQALGLALQTRRCKSKCVSGSCVYACVLQRSLLGNKLRISARFGHPWYFWLVHKGILKHTHAPSPHTHTHTHHIHSVKSETFPYRHLHKSNIPAQHTHPVLTLMHV